MIFVTGGAGFIGSNFIHFLTQKTDEEIVILDKVTYAGDVKNLYPLAQHQLIRVDLCDIEKLRIIFSKYNPSKIFHFAAESHVDNSILNVMPFVETNIIGTVNLLQLSNDYNVDMFHHISTDEVYGSLGYNDSSFTEKTPYDPQNPYSASKAASDHFVMSFHNTYGLPVKITNCSNNYGPRQNVEKLIPKTITNILQGKKIPVYGKGENIRDWIYVEDHCEAIYEVFNHGKVGEKYNIGGECEVKNIDLIKNLLNLLNASEDLIEYVKDRPGHDLRYSIDNAKIKGEIGWNPKYNLEEGLKKTIEWYKNDYI
jgi:dTDP-glucose 4,6-dehydratase